MEAKHGYTDTHTHIFWLILIHVHTRCLLSVIKSSHAWSVRSPLMIWRPPAGHRGGCFPWTCFMRLHVLCSLWESGPLGKRSPDRGDLYPVSLSEQLTNLSPTPRATSVSDWRGSQWVASHPQYGGGHRFSHVFTVYVLIRSLQEQSSQESVRFGKTWVCLCARTFHVHSKLRHFRGLCSFISNSVLQPVDNIVFRMRCRIQIKAVK